MLRTFSKYVRNSISRTEEEGAELRKAEACARRGRWAASVKHYERFLSKNPGSFEALLGLARSLQYCGQFERAIERYAQAAELDGTDDRTFLNMSVCLRQTGNSDTALKVLIKAFKLNPSGPAKDELAQLIGVSDGLLDFITAVEECFDPSYYLTVYGDIRQAGVDPFNHYLLYGWREDRAPSPFFDPIFYRTKHKRHLRDVDNSLVHYWQYGRALNLRASPSGGAGMWFTPIAPALADWEVLTPARYNEHTTIAVVIIPVFKGYDETLCAIYEALKARGDSNYSILVLNDCGPDAKLNEELARIAELGLFNYVMNEENIGFVQTCNKGICELSGHADVVLLNSDAYVFPGWFERVRAHILRDDRVGTVTPLSNNATVSSYPITNHENFKALEVSPAQLDALAADINAGLACETPTGVGFCFYMTRKCISQVGPLDAVAFRLGYGEENDFCMRALEAGFKNIIAGDVFAYHVGSVSFSAIKEENFNAGQAAVEYKHPNYPRLVSRYISADPAKHIRKRLDSVRLSNAAKHCIVFITHAWGGGIQTYLEEKKRELDASGKEYITIIVKDKHYVTVDATDSPLIFVPNLSDIDLRVEFDFLADLISGLSPELFHINSFAGLEWGFHMKLLNYVMESRVPYKFIAHDYAAISRFYHLTRPDGVYVGLPSWDELEEWSRMTDVTSPEISDVRARRAVYSQFLRHADTVEFPSAAARDTFQRYFNGFQGAIVPHVQPFDTREKAMRRAADGKLRIACIGAIGHHKGSDVILSLARDARSRHLPIEIVVVGYTDDDEAMKSAGVTVSGAYASEAEAIEYLKTFAPDLAFISSVWPETFCYTLSIALALKLPCAVFDLGAQAERVKAVDWCAAIDPMLINNTRALSAFLLDLDVDRLWRNSNESST